MSRCSDFASKQLRRVAYAISSCYRALRNVYASSCSGEAMSTCSGETTSNCFGEIISATSSSETTSSCYRALRDTSASSCYSIASVTS